MATFEQFPITFRPSSQMWFLKPAVKFGPILPDGSQQRVQSAAPHWIAETDYLLLQPANIREMRAYVTKMMGGAREFIMPVHDRSRAPWPTGYDYTSAKQSVSWSGGRNFSVALKRQIIQVRANSAAVAGAATLSILQMTDGKIRRGHFFTIIDDTGRARLYQIDEAIQESTSTVGATYTISFQPPLRAPCPAKKPLDFDDPMCTMTLAETQSGAITEEAQSGARAQLKLRESFGGL